jgi:hypothetical protein
MVNTATVRLTCLILNVILNQHHAAMALHEYQLHYNDHRLHRSLGQAAPLRPPPDRARTETNNVRRRDQLGGLLHEYQQVALAPVIHGATG